MPIDSRKKRLSALSFGSDDLLPDPDGTIDAGDRLTLLGLYSGILAAAPPAPAKGPPHKKKIRPTSQALDFRKVLADKQARTEAAEEAMWTSRLQQQLAARKTLVAAMVNADRQRQKALAQQLNDIDARVRQIQMDLAKLKAGIKQ